MLEVLLSNHKKLVAIDLGVLEIHDAKRTKGKTIWKIIVRLNPMKSSEPNYCTLWYSWKY